MVCKTTSNFISFFLHVLLFPLKSAARRIRQDLDTGAIALTNSSSNDHSDRQTVTYSSSIVSTSSEPVQFENDARGLVIFWTSLEADDILAIKALIEDNYKDRSRWDFKIIYAADLKRKDAFDYGQAKIRFLQNLIFPLKTAKSGEVTRQAFKNMSVMVSSQPGQIFDARLSFYENGTIYLRSLQGSARKRFSEKRLLEQAHKKDLSKEDWGRDYSHFHLIHLAPAFGQYSSLLSALRNFADARGPQDECFAGSLLQSPAFLGSIAKVSMKSKDLTALERILKKTRCILVVSAYSFENSLEKGEERNPRFALHDWPDEKHGRFNTNRMFGYAMTSAEFQNVKASWEAEKSEFMRSFGWADKTTVRHKWQKTQKSNYFPTNFLKRVLANELSELPGGPKRLLVENRLTELADAFLAYQNQLLHEFPDLPASDLLLPFVLQHLNKGGGAVEVVPSSLSLNQFQLRNLQMGVVRKGDPEEMGEKIRTDYRRFLLVNALGLPETVYETVFKVDVFYGPITQSTCRSMASSLLGLYLLICWIICG